MKLKELYEMAVRKVGGDAASLVANKRSGNPSKNTTVTYNDATGISEVSLHGHLIFQYDHKKKRFWFTDAGWQTNTTKSRINDLFDDLRGLIGGGLKVFAKNYTWYLNVGGDTVELDEVKELWYKSPKDIIEGKGKA